MRQHLVLLLVLLISARSIALEKKDKGELDRWAKQKQSELLKDCSKEFRAEWLKRYDKIELDYIQKLEDIGDAAIKDRKNSPVFWDLGKIVFPQDLPKAFPMGGVFSQCFDHLDDYRNARNNVEGMKAMKQLETCQKDLFRVDAPPIMKDFMTCLKKIKY